MTDLHSDSIADNKFNLPVARQKNGHSGTCSLGTSIFISAVEITSLFGSGHETTKLSD